MKWSSARAPSLEDIRDLAEAALARLPRIFTERLEGLAILVEEFPDDETLDALGLDSPFDLLGLYSGVDLTRKSVSDLPVGPDLIHLYRRPLLDAWCESAESLGAVVTHVLVHEIGHHFGLSDEAMAAIESQAGPEPG
jgi:predicted Zn-dependent protease with MMP-like domain